MARVKVLEPIRYNGKRREPGTVIAMQADVASKLDGTKVEVLPEPKPKKDKE